MKFKAGWAFTAVAFAFAAYSVFVILSGLGFDPIGLHWNFAVSGALGDSFGPLSTLMAAVAAISAIAAYFSQSAELREARARGNSQQESADKRDFESTFFNLLQLFRETVKEIDVLDQYGQNPVRGRDALKRILDDRIGGTRGSDSEDSSIFKGIYDQYRDDLAHYFRLFYQVLRFIDESSVNNKMLYVRLLRATLSNAEIVLIALNCLHGGGKVKLKPLVERYALLQNISAGDAKSRRLIASFDHNAFGDRTFQDPDSEFPDNY